MCRLLAYHGVPICLDHLLYKPRNSLIRQSFAAKEIEEPLNGDGFGVGWYVPEIDSTPAVFVSTSPAWSNRNLRMMAPKVKSPSVFAHVRAASVGDTSEANCHPFSFGRFICMHNGSIGGFPKIKRALRRGLCDEVYNWIRGQTDSEHFFAVFLDLILKKGDQYGLGDMVAALGEALKYVEDLKSQFQITEPSYMNVVVSDGERVVGARFVANDDEALSLYYSEGRRYACKGDVCELIEASATDRSALIVSEKLTDLEQDWKEVPVNHLVIIDQDKTVSTQAI